ncbi:MAG TPA: ABC-type transport auxiliary lipoprotein family protein [Verrucomicrobiae bacterium]|jgi:ABC-type uncharacterized transport system auxiliary subunit|nr:ABC-type transport auxiliary lipoprotein family protein [Verrucomicrobiae bacterium]
MNILRTFPYVSLCLLAGCFGRPHLDKQTFIFAPPSVTTRSQPTINRVLGIRTVEVAEPFQGRSFVYRTGEFSYERDPYAEFMVHPADALAAPIARGFRDSGEFSAVTEPGSALKPNIFVEINVDQLYGDFRSTEPPAAVLAIRFVFIDAPGGMPGQVLLQREYSRKIPLKAKSPGALIEGWNQALGQILDSVTLDFSHVDSNTTNQ